MPLYPSYQFCCFCEWKMVFFLIVFQVLISLLIVMLYSENKCTLSLGTQLRTQYTCKVELIGWKWIGTCELNFNYTSDTWIYFLIHKINVLQIKRFLLISHTTSSGLFPHSEVVLGFLLFTQNVFLCPLKHMCVHGETLIWEKHHIMCVCLQRQGVYTLKVLLSA